MKQLLLSIFLMMLSSISLAHSRWKLDSKLTPPRDNSVDLKTAPCGGVPRTKEARQFKSGDRITVEFEETVNHAGYFEIHFLPAKDSADGIKNSLLDTVYDKQDEPIADGKNHEFSHKIELPDMECEDCTLQLIQVIQDDPADPEKKSFHYSCSDIQLVYDPQPPPPKPPTPKPAGLKLERR